MREISQGEPGIDRRKPEWPEVANTACELLMDLEGEK